MTEAIKTIIYPVKDIAAAKTLYSALLGVEPYVDEPYYVGFRVHGQEVGLDPHDHRQGMTRTVGYCHVDDINADGNVIGLVHRPERARRRTKEPS